MNPLARLQDEFQSFLLRGDAAIEGQVVGTERVPVETRLGIYSDAYHGRLLEALQANFPVLAKMAGETDFVTLAGDYIQAHPSPFFSIRHYGHALPEFLANASDYAGVPVLAELARWEWALTEVFDAADAVPVDMSMLANVPAEQWAELRLEWHPSARRLDLLWNVPSLWRALTDDAERPEMTVRPEPVPWLLWRRGLETYFRSLSMAEAAVVDAAREGAPFGELCALLSEWTSEAEAPAQAAGFLRQWLLSGLIVAIA